MHETEVQRIMPSWYLEISDNIIKSHDNVLKYLSKALVGLEGFPYSWQQEKVIFISLYISLGAAWMIINAKQKYKKTWEKHVPPTVLKTVGKFKIWKLDLQTIASHPVINKTQTQTSNKSFSVNSFAIRVNLVKPLGTFHVAWWA